jgi:ubiquitin carboxyl-terminal hydrolase 14
MMGVKSSLKLKCEETGEEINETAISYMLKCNIDANTNHVNEGLVLALKEDREKRSEVLGRDALFQGSSVITQLPAYLTVQMVRASGSAKEPRL